MRLDGGEYKLFSNLSNNLLKVLTVNVYQVYKVQKLVNLNLPSMKLLTVPKGL